MQGTLPPLENVVIPVMITVGGNLVIWGLTQYAVNHREKVSLQSAEAREIELRIAKRAEDLEAQQKMINEQMWEDRRLMRDEMEKMRTEHRSEIDEARAHTRQCEEEREALAGRVQTLEHRMNDSGGANAGT